jgi:hypothetical protein
MRGENVVEQERAVHSLATTTGFHNCLHKQKTAPITRTKNAPETFSGALIRKSAAKTPRSSPGRLFTQKACSSGLSQRKTPVVVNHTQTTHGHCGAEKHVKA